jgi:hypothetical protein
MTERMNHSTLSVDVVVSERRRQIKSVRRRRRDGNKSLTGRLASLLSPYSACQHRKANVTSTSPLPPTTSKSYLVFAECRQVARTILGLFDSLFDLTMGCSIGHSVDTRAMCRNGYLIEGQPKPSDSFFIIVFHRNAHCDSLCLYHCMAISACSHQFKPARTWEDASAEFQIPNDHKTDRLRLIQRFQSRCWQNCSLFSS